MAAKKWRAVIGIKERGNEVGENNESGFTLIEVAVASIHHDGRPGFFSNALYVSYVAKPPC